MVNQTNKIRKLQQCLVKESKNNYKGRCFQFYMDMKVHFPTAVPIYNGNHVLTLIGDVVVDANSIYLPMSNEYQQKAKQWHLQEESEK